MKTIISDSRFSAAKTAIAAPLMKADAYRDDPGSKWYNASTLQHGTFVQAVNHFGRHITEQGDTVQIDVVESDPIIVKILNIRAVSVDQLTEMDFQELGYSSRADYMADFGELNGSKLWFMRFQRLE